MILEGTRRHRVPVTLCGEMAGRPLEASALIALGFRAISMAPASIGPVKTMILSMNVGEARDRMAKLLQKEAMDRSGGSLRESWKEYARLSGMEL